jgi:hypothetical protein
VAKFTRARRVKIRGNWWRVIIGRTPVRHVDGYCKFSDRTIYIRPRADRFSTAVHEVLHACFPDIEESAIVEAEAAIMDVLHAVTPED